MTTTSSEEKLDKSTSGSNALLTGEEQTTIAINVVDFFTDPEDAGNKDKFVECTYRLHEVLVFNQRRDNVNTMGADECAEVVRSSLRSCGKLQKEINSRLLISAFDADIIQSNQYSDDLFYEKIIPFASKHLSKGYQDREAQLLAGHMYGMMSALYCNLVEPKIKSNNQLVTRCCIAIKRNPRRTAVVVSFAIIGGVATGVFAPYLLPVYLAVLAKTVGGVTVTATVGAGVGGLVGYGGKPLGLAVRNFRGNRARRANSKQGLSASLLESVVDAKHAISASQSQMSRFSLFSQSGSFSDCSDQSSVNSRSCSSSASV